MRYIASIGEQTYAVGLPENGHQREVTLDERTVAVDWRPVGDTSLTSGEVTDGQSAHYSLLVGSRSFDVYLQPVAAEDDDGAAHVYEAHVCGQVFRVRLADERTQALASLAGGGHAAGDANIRAPMPGLVSNVLVEEGAEVRRGQAVVVLEAMKMENDLTTPRPGIVKSLRAKKGQTVNQNDLLVVIGDPAGSAASDEDDETLS